MRLKFCLLFCLSNVRVMSLSQIILCYNKNFTMDVVTDPRELHNGNGIMKEEKVQSDFRIVIASSMQ